MCTSNQLSTSSVWMNAHEQSAQCYTQSEWIRTSNQLSTTPGVNEGYQQPAQRNTQWLTDWSHDLGRGIVGCMQASDQTESSRLGLLGYTWANWDQLSTVVDSVNTDNLVKAVNEEQVLLRLAASVTTFACVPVRRSILSTQIRNFLLNTNKAIVRVIMLDYKSKL